MTGLQLVQLGVGSLDIVDPDRVEQTNRNRQLFTEHDIGCFKAHALPKQLRRFATYRTILRGLPVMVQDWQPDTDYDAIICGVDNEGTNAYVAHHAFHHEIPLVIVNVSRDGEACRIFIQRPGQACFACYRPTAYTDPRPAQPCLPTPAIVDILHVATGFAIRALTGELLSSPIGEYNCRDVTMSGTDLIKTVERRAICPLCRP